MHLVYFPNVIVYTGVSTFTERFQFVGETIDEIKLIRRTMDISLVCDARALESTALDVLGVDSSAGLHKSFFVKYLPRK